MSDRTLVICDEITSDVVREFLHNLAILDSEDGPIEVRICSNGGWTQGGFAMYDAIRACRNKVTTIGLGIVGSAAVLVLQAGDKRLLGPNAQLFLHEPTMNGGGSPKELTSALANMERMHFSYKHLIADRTGKLTVAQISIWCANDTHIVAGRAIKEGLADGLYERGSKRGKKK